MALGDITYDKGVVAVGNKFQITGTLEASSTATEFAVASSRWITSAVVQNSDDVEGAGVTLNSDDGTAGTQKGSIWVDSASSGVDTWNYIVQFI